MINEKNPSDINQNSPLNNKEEGREKKKNNKNFYLSMRGPLFSATHTHIDRQTDDDTHKRTNRWTQTLSLIVAAQHTDVGVTQLSWWSCGLPHQNSRLFVEISPTIFRYTNFDSIFKFWIYAVRRLHISRVSRASLLVCDASGLRRWRSYCDVCDVWPLGVSVCVMCVSLWCLTWSCYCEKPIIQYKCVKHEQTHTKSDRCRD